MKYLLIDGNNLAIRAAFANSGLTNSDGTPTGVHYGFFQSIINLKRKFSDHKFVVVWDGKSQRRIKEAEWAVETGLICSGYKANRKEKPYPQPLLDFYEQAIYLKRAIEQVGIAQVRYLEYEADDVIAAYCEQLKASNEIIVVTSDKDYFQILDENVSLWDGMKKEFITKEQWEQSNGISPSQHVDCGALMGDVGDNIFGLPSWGEKTANKAIKKFGTYTAVLENLHEQYDAWRVAHPDLDEKDIVKLQEIETKSGKLKYPGVTVDMYFTGVALALELGLLSKIPKTSLMALIYEDRAKLAYSLKKMDRHIKGLPEIPDMPINIKRFLEYLDYYDIESLNAQLDVFEEQEF